jgi:predicted PilT family ATPase
VVLRGRSRDVEELASKIQEFVAEQERDDLERGYTTSFDFPQKFANFLIGRKGENINKLREEFDVDIKVENGKVEVKGPKSKADAAKARIQSLGKKLEDEATYVLKVPPQYHRDLIGQKGSQVNRLQDRYNVRVQFPRAANSSVNDDQSVADTASEVGGSRNNRSNQAPDEVIVRGPRKGADAAREEILSLYQWVMDHSHTASVSVAQSQIPSLIGQRGREMDKLRADTGAQIDVPSVHDAADAAGRVEIKLKGTKKQVDDARKLLLQRAKEFDATVTKTIDVDKKYHKALIGGGGQFTSLSN